MRLALSTETKLDPAPFAHAMLRDMGVRPVEPSLHRLVLALLRSAFRAEGAA